jgi:pimeloyl-ACP methyl ester carboxylesterase
MPAREISHTVRNVRVRLFTAGHGPPLLFLHGAGGIERWLLFFDLLAARYAVMVPAKVEIVPACGHLMHVEKVEVVANRILAFADGDGTWGASACCARSLKAFARQRTYSGSAIK